MDLIAPLALLREWQAIGHPAAFAIYTVRTWQVGIGSVVAASDEKVFADLIKNICVAEGRFTWE